MAKKKSKQVLRPWCWYCEREFEDEKVLMQHQKAKHFKCGLCPRRLNTAGGLAVHIQQVHKLEADNLPRIENALPGRDGYEVEIFGMEGIPAPDVADYKRRKEIELGLAAGSISQPPAKRPKTENRAMTEDELKAALEAHKALMGRNNDNTTTTDNSAGGVYGAPPQAYAAPPTPAQVPPSGIVPPPGLTPPPFMPPPPGMGVPGQPPFLPPPGMPGFPPGPPPPGFAMPLGFPPPGMMPPGMPPPGMPPGMAGMPPPPGMFPGSVPPGPPRPPIGAAPTFVPSQQNAGQPPSPFPPSNFATPPPPSSSSATPTHPSAVPSGQVSSSQPTLPKPELKQTNPPFKKATVLKYEDANFSPEELRAYHVKYRYIGGAPTEGAEESRGKKRARAEDFL